ncbi:MAG: hypothetical protein FJ241_13580, partial [Nitrospira sp.]|nr:hypothetical protein [Nitrospira sp.]
MKKFLILLFLFFLLANVIGCGSSSSKYDNKIILGKTAVTIKLGETKKTSHSGNILNTSGIPSEVANIRFTISVPGMTTIQRVVANTGQDTISETFNVPNGTSRHFLVEALDTSDNVLYKGETDADLDGTPVTLTINPTTILIQLRASFSYFYVKYKQHNYVFE